MGSVLRFAVQFDRVEVGLGQLADALDHQRHHDPCHDFRCDAQSARTELLLQLHGAGMRLHAKYRASGCRGRWLRP